VKSKKLTQELKRQIDKDVGFAKLAKSNFTFPSSKKMAVI
jgi:hypothetical protein